MNRPRLFVSAVTEELGAARRTAAAVVRNLGYDPVSQDDFPTGHGELRQWLREQIDSCEGLIQLVGRGYGAEPPDPDPEFGRVSYTQFEFLYAAKQSKKTWVFILKDTYLRDKPTDRLDLPGDRDHPDSRGYQAERQKLQEDYIARLREENHLWHEVDTEDKLKLKIREMRDELGELRQSEEDEKAKLAEDIKALKEGVQDASVVNTEKIRAHLLQTIEETHRRELAEADEANDWKERERLRKVAETAHAGRLSRIDDLAASFAEITGSGTASNVFQEMDRILREQGVDEAIAYVGTKRASILQTVRTRSAAAHERNRADLQPLLQTAALYQSKGQSSDARSIYSDILAAEPEWPEALHQNFRFSVARGDVAMVRATLADACGEYEGAHRLAQRLVLIDPANGEWKRDLSASYERLGNLAMDQGRLDEAARAYGEYLKTAKKLTAMDLGNNEWQRDLSVSYERLGNVAMAQGKLDEAARAYGEGLEIHKKLATIDPGNTEWQRDLSVSYEKLGDVAVAQGRLGDAASAYGEDLEIAKKLAAIDPGNTGWQRDLFVSYNKLGDVAVAQNKLDEATRVYGDGLEIAKKLTAMDPGNTQWQRDLSVSYNRLGDVAVAQKRLDDAAKAYGDRLEIRKKLAAIDPGNTGWQRDLSVSYEKLGDVAVAQGRLDEAARYYGDGLEIRKKLAAIDPGNTEWQRDLSVSYEKLGDVAKAQGRLDEAARYYGDSLEIRKKLAATDPGNAQWQRDLWVLFWRLADLAERQKKPDEARGYWEQAFGVLTTIEQRGLHLSPEDRKFLEILRGKVRGQTQ